MKRPRGGSNDRTNPDFANIFLASLFSRRDFVPHSLVNGPNKPTKRTTVYSVNDVAVLVSAADDRSSVYPTRLKPPFHALHKFGRFVT